MNNNTPRQPNNRGQYPQNGQYRQQQPPQRPQYPQGPAQNRPVQRPPQQNAQYAQRVPQQVPRQNPYGQPYPRVKHRSRRQAKRTAGLVLLTVVILVMLLTSVIIFAARYASGKIGGDPVDPTVTTPPVTDDIGDPAVTTPAVTTEPPPETTSLADTYEFLEKSAEEIHRGYQILVNYQNEFLFDNIFKMQTFYGNRNKSYKIRDTIISADVRMMNELNNMMIAMEAESGLNDALVNSAFRDFDEQEAIFANRVDTYGEEYAQLFVAMPGHSEHHTGLAVDFTVYTDDNQAKTFDKAPEYPEWLRANAHRFGFIERYTADKTEFTKITYENWHYRYIGKPHAYYMVKNNLCLEEYIDLLRKYEFGKNTLLITDDEGDVWEIYFVRQDADGSTSVPVPKYMSYELSGNNVDGFIVTCKAG